jgi:hypothetical protein
LPKTPFGRNSYAALGKAKMLLGIFGHWMASSAQNYQREEHPIPAIEFFGKLLKLIE